MKKSKNLMKVFFLTCLLVIVAFIIVKHCEDGCMGQVKAEDADQAAIAEALDVAKNAGLDAITETDEGKITSANEESEEGMEQVLSETEDSDATGKTENEVSEKETTEVPSNPTQEMNPTPASAHTHHWVTVEATGHNETIVVQAAWDEPMYEGAYICNQCNFVTTDGEKITVHCAEYNHNCYVDEVQTGTIHHEALTETHWVQDSPQYEVCSECGATR